MSESNDNTGHAIPTAGQIRTATQFVAAHGKPARGVVEPIGRAGARVVLIGADGAMGDLVVDSAEVAQALIDQVADIEPADWDAETVEATDIGADHRRRMGRSILRG